MTTIIDGNEVAADTRGELSSAIDQLADNDITPGLATVLMSDDPASETYVSMKQRACEDLSMNGIHVEIDPSQPAEELFDRISELNNDSEVHGILVQLPLPDHVNNADVLDRIDPWKDVDGFHPENIGRLVAGNPRYKPCTPHGVIKLLESIDLDLEGLDVTIVGRSSIVGKPLANMMIQKGPGGNATVTVCHSRTTNLEDKTRRADVVVSAVGVPEFIDGTMLSDGVVVIDVGVNRLDADNEKGYRLVGDVEFESAKKKADAITPVPGGVGPMTIAMLLYNTVKAASAIESVDIDLP